MKEAVSRWNVGTLVLALTIGAGITSVQSQEAEQDTVFRSGEVLYAASQDSSSRPGISDSAGLPLMIREQLRLFEEKREAYLADQLNLLRQMRGASSEERARLREQLREQRKDWLEESKQIREQARVRLQEMKQELANHGEVIEAARERARERAAEGAEKGRERRGTD